MEEEIELDAEIRTITHAMSQIDKYFENKIYRGLGFNQVEIDAVESIGDVCSQFAKKVKKLSS